MGIRNEHTGEVSDWKVMGLQEGRTDPTCAGLCGIPAGMNIGACVSHVSLVRAVLLGDKQGCYGVGEHAGQSVIGAGGVAYWETKVCCFI